MHIIAKDKDKFAFGLDWISLGESELKSKLKELTGKNSPFGAPIKAKVFQADEDNSVLGFSTDKKAVGCASSALVLQDMLYSSTDLEEYAAENVVFFFDVIDEKLWVCGYSERSLMYSTDKLLDVHNHHEPLDVELDSIFNILETVVENIYFFASEEALSILNGISYFESHSSLTFNHVSGFSFFDYVDTFDFSGSELKPYLLSKAEQITQKNLLILIGVLAASFFVINMTGVFDSPTIDVSKQIKKKTTIKKKTIKTVSELMEDKEAKIREIKAAAYREEVRWLNEAFNSQEPVTILENIELISSKLPSYIGGWKVESVSFKGTNIGRLSVNLTRGVMGTPITLRKSLTPTYSSLSITPDGNNAHINYKIPDSVRAEKVSNVSKYIPTIEYKTENLIHDAHFNGLIWSTNQHKFGNRQKPIAGIPKEEANTPLLRLTGDDITLSGDQNYQIKYVKNILRHAKTSLITSFTINKADNNQWSVSLLLYK